jgi:hypothetical protein
LDNYYWYNIINQTIKCLLIAPNPESALNEEAGKLLLKEYDTYAKRAKLFTSIHAMKHKVEFPTTENLVLNADRESSNKAGILTSAISKNNISPMKRSVENGLEGPVAPVKKMTSKLDKKSIKRL